MHYRTGLNLPNMSHHMQRNTIMKTCYGNKKSDKSYSKIKFKHETFKILVTSYLFDLGKTKVNFQF